MEEKKLVKLKLNEFNDNTINEIKQAINLLIDTLEIEVNEELEGEENEGGLE